VNGQVEVKADAGKPVEAQTGRSYRLTLEAPAIDYTLKDEDGNPCAFFAFELEIFPAAANGAAPAATRTLRGHLDERGHIRIEPAPAGKYRFTFFDDLGRRLRAVDLIQGPKPT
jgi:hypothetical protein